MESPPGPETVIDGQRYWYFGGTGYLGLAGHPEIIEAACAAVRRYGVHTATSRTGFGHNPVTLEVECQAAGFFGAEDAFYFVSGYVGNHIMVEALADQISGVFIDEAAHFSLQEAARLAGKPVARFHHRDPAELARCLAASPKVGEKPLILTDGVFPMSGALAPIRGYLEVLRRHAPAFLHVDDAHGFGVLGANGRGILEHFGLWPHVNGGPALEGTTLTVCGTLSKALGGFGGIIPGSRAFVRQIRAASHYFEGASAPSSADAGASAAALAIAQREPERRRQLAANCARLRAGLRGLGLAISDDPSANFCVEIGDAAAMQAIHLQLRTAGFLVPYFAAYSNLSRAGALRFAVCALHPPEIIDRLIAALRDVLR